MCGFIVVVKHGKVSRTQEVGGETECEEVLLVPVRGVGTGSAVAHRARNAVPAAVFALDSLIIRRCEDRGAVDSAVWRDPQVEETLRAAAQLGEVATHLVGAAILREALFVERMRIDCDLSVSCDEMGVEGDSNLQFRPSKRSPKVSATSGVWSLCDPKRPSAFIRDARKEETYHRLRRPCAWHPGAEASSREVEVESNMW